MTFEYSPLSWWTLKRSSRALWSQPLPPTTVTSCADDSLNSMDKPNSTPEEDHADDIFDVAHTESMVASADPTSMVSERSSLLQQTQGTHNRPSLPTAGPRLQGFPIFRFDANFPDTATDTLILASDGIFFTTHSHILMEASNNNLAGLLTHNNDTSPGFPYSLVATEPSSVVAIVLLSLYGVSCSIRDLSFQYLAYAILTFKKYGLAPIRKYVAPGKPLHEGLMPYIPIYPTATYVLAAAADLEDIAVMSSAYVLAVPIHKIPQELVDLMGMSYMRRLYGVQETRRAYLKSLLDERTDIRPHVAKPYCSLEKQEELIEHYKRVCMQVYYHASPAITKVAIEIPMGRLTDLINCPDCKSSFKNHVNSICARWSSFPSTI